VLWKFSHASEDVSVHVKPRFVSNNGEIIHQLAIEGHGLFSVQFGMLQMN
jgi:LysR family transcriptional activator of dmlA